MTHRPSRRGRTVASILSLTGALAVSAVLAPLAGAASPAKKTTKPVVPLLTPNTPVTPGSGYLALGDSFTFGYQEAQVVPTPDYADASSFTGYPELLASGLKLKLANASCPGETSSSFLNASAASNGCETAGPGGTVGYRQAFPLHVKYSGSQAAYAVKYLKSHQNVRLVSLQIGGNDLLYCQETTADGCTSLAEEASLVGTVTANLRKIMTAIRTKAGYTGQVVYVGYYPPTSAYAAVNAQFQTYINQALKPFKVKIDNPSTAFAAAAAHSGGSLCTAGLETQLTGASTPCGIHPSYAGQALYAQTVLKAITVG
jgi:lysophospholipase L1-like esterase